MFWNKFCRGRQVRMKPWVMSSGPSPGQVPAHIHRTLSPIANSDLTFTHLGSVLETQHSGVSCSQQNGQKLQPWLVSEEHPWTGARVPGSLFLFLFFISLSFLRIEKARNTNNKRNNEKTSKQTKQYFVSVF